MFGEVTAYKNFTSLAGVAGVKTSPNPINIRSELLKSYTLKLCLDISQGTISAMGSNVRVVNQPC